MTRYISGIQPTGQPHLGNYFGAIKQHIELQDKVDNPNDALFFVADFHALTNGTLTRKELANNTEEVITTYLALGLDLNKSRLFCQSSMGGIHPSVAFVLACNIGSGVLMRQHAYQSKIEAGLVPNAGLLYYPILMAADILLYDADIVPVGIDQKQHIELARDIAQAFNSRYGETFKLPKAQFSETPRVIGTDGRKMSKSYNNTIPILDKPKKIKKIIMSIETDSTDYTTTPLDPDECTVFQLYSLFSNEEELVRMRDLYINDRSFGYGHAKKMLFEKHQESFGEAYKKQQELKNDQLYLSEILNPSSLAAYEICRLKEAKVLGTIGLRA